jgi:hypothetical protein
MRHIWDISEWTEPGLTSHTPNEGGRPLLEDGENNTDHSELTQDS